MADVFTEVSVVDLRKGDHFCLVGERDNAILYTVTKRGSQSTTYGGLGVDHFSVQWEGGHLDDWPVASATKVLRQTPAASPVDYSVIKAKAETKKWRDRYNELEDVFTRGISEADLDTVTKVLQRVRDNIRNKNAGVY